MNVLITSAGRRTSLLTAFQSATRLRSGLTYGGDVDHLAPALYLADGAIRLPRTNREEFLPSLLEAVERHQIQVLVPTTDPELPIFAAARGEFQRRGCEPLISDPDLVEVFGDKWQTMEACQEWRIAAPASWLPDSLPSTDLPANLVVKPRAGSASQNVFRIAREELAAVLPRVPDPIVQEEIRAPEITIDALLSFTGKPLHFVPRLRLRAVGGESIQGQTIRRPHLGEWIEQVLIEIGQQGGRGPITVQAFLTDRGPLLSEVNLRFGGGVPLTLAAGGLYPEWILQMVGGEEVPSRLGEYRENLYMTRHYVEIFRENLLWE